MTSNSKPAQKRQRRRRWRVEDNPKAKVWCDNYRRHMRENHGIVLTDDQVLMAWTTYCVSLAERDGYDFGEGADHGA